MLIQSLRLAFLVTTLVASLHVAAAPRYWTLTGVQFIDGTIATGYFSYDDATQTIANWNIHVDQRLVFVWFPPFTYVPGNSHSYTFQSSQAPFSAPRGLGLSAPLGSKPGGDFEGRGLQIRPHTPLDGSNVTVSIAYALVGGSFFSSGESFGEGDDGRFIVAGSLTLTPTPPPTALVQVDEFYNAVLQHYFMTASAAEKHDLDTGVHAGWERTRESFRVYLPESVHVSTFAYNPNTGNFLHFLSTPANNGATGNSF